MKSLVALPDALSTKMVNEFTVLEDQHQSFFHKMESFFLLGCCYQDTSVPFGFQIANEGLDKSYFNALSLYSFIITLLMLLFPLRKLYRI